MANLIDHLPRDSFFAEALLDDDDFARSVLAREQPEPRERIAEWSRTVEMLAQIVDAMRGNTAATVAAAGGKPSPVKPVQRPYTAIDRVKRERRIAAHRDLVAQVLGRDQ